MCFKEVLAGHANETFQRLQFHALSERQIVDSGGGGRVVLGFEAEEKYLYDWPELGTAAIDEAVLERLHSDVRGVHDREPAAVRERNQARQPGSP